MFYYLNKHTVVQVVLIGCLLLLSGFRIFTHMTLLPPDGQMILYRLLFPLWQTHPVHYKIIAIVLLIIEVFLIQGYYRTKNFAELPTFMPAFFFLLLMNTGNLLKTFTPAYFTIVFFTITMFMNMDGKKEQSAKSAVFFSGIWVGLSILFDPIAIWIALFVILALIANHCLGFKEFVILLSGILTTSLYVFTFYFLMDQWPQLKEACLHYPYFGIIHSSVPWKAIAIVKVSYFCLLLAYMVIILKLFYDNKLIVLRKHLVVVFLILIVSIIMLFFSMYDFQAGFIYLFIPISLYFSMLSLLKNRRVWHDILLVSFFVLVCL